VAANAVVPATSASAVAADGGATPLMLWKKVQHCVIYGGHFISSAKEKAEQQHEQHQRDAAERQRRQQQQQQQQQQRPQP